MAKSQAECDLENPEEAFAWMFTAGIPDPRGGKYPHQPAIPPQCFKALSKMIWDMGGRVHPELQTRWVKARPTHSPLMNFEAWGTTDIQPEQIQELAEKEPEVAAEVAGIGKRLSEAKSPEEVKAVQDEVRDRVLGGLEKIRQYTEAKSK